MPAFALSQAQSSPGTTAREAGETLGPNLSVTIVRHYYFFFVLNVISLLKCSLPWIRSDNFFLPYGLVDNERSRHEGQSRIRLR